MRTKSNPYAASPAQMRLLGKRLVIVSETEKNRHLAAALMKNLTGGDPVTARPLYGSPVTFDPSHTVLMVTNFKPKVDGDDPAVWRRIRVVPFDVSFEGREDTGLRERLSLELDAILTWAVNGYRAYVERGMDAPEAVLTATSSYQHESDAIAQFIEDRCVTIPGVSASTTQLHNAFLEWARTEGFDEPMGRKQFGQALDLRGHKAGSRRLRQGIGLAADEDMEG